MHTNCLAALANMSSQFRNLHPYVSQRIVSMFETLAKKHNRLVTTLHQGDVEGDFDWHNTPYALVLFKQKSILEYLNIFRF